MSEKKTVVSKSEMDVLEVLEPIVYRMWQIDSFCLVLANAVENGETNEQQYVPAVGLLSELMHNVHQDAANLVDLLIFSKK